MNGKRKIGWVIWPLRHAHRKYFSCNVWPLWYIVTIKNSPFYMCTVDICMKLPFLQKNWLFMKSDAAFAEHIYMKQRSTGHRGVQKNPYKNRHFKLGIKDWTVKHFLHICSFLKSLAVNLTSLNSLKPAGGCITRRLLFDNNVE